VPSLVRSWCSRPRYPQKPFFFKLQCYLKTEGEGGGQTFYFRHRFSLNFLSPEGNFSF
jgi:hypothetical protein